MYCPECFQDTLRIRPKGVLRLKMNGKSRDNSLFNFNLIEETKTELLAKLEIKMDELFRWYSEFKNREQITSFELFTQDIFCERSCPIRLSQTKTNVVDLFLTKEEIQRLLVPVAEKYGIELHARLKLSNN